MMFTDHSSNNTSFGNCVLWQQFTNGIEKRSLSVICESYSNRKEFFLLTTNL